MLDKEIELQNEQLEELELLKEQIMIFLEDILKKMKLYLR